MKYEYYKWPQSVKITLYIQKRITGFDAPKYKMICVNDETGSIDITDIFLNWYPNKQKLTIELPIINKSNFSLPKIYIAIDTTHGFDTLLESTEKEFLTALEML